MVERCNEDMEVKKVTNLEKDLGWDEDRKALDNILACDVLEAFDEITPAELVKHWKITSSWTDEEVKQELRELYDSLPRVKLKAWERVNVPTKKNKKAMVQFRFAESFAKMFEVDDVYVVGKHVVQDTVLPVYMLTLPEVEFTFFSDFCGWDVVVNITLEFLDKTEEFFSKFKSDVKFSENKLKFSIRLLSDHELYEFMKKLKEYLES